MYVNTVVAFLDMSHNVGDDPCRWVVSVRMFPEAHFNLKFKTSLFSTMK